MSIENKKISEDELDNVTGGCAHDITVESNRSKYNDYTIPVDMYCGQIGTKYLFVKNKKDSQWLFGELVNSYEANQGAWTVRTHDIRVEDGAGFEEANTISVSEYGTTEIPGKSYQMYAKG